MQPNSFVPKKAGDGQYAAYVIDAGQPLPRPMASQKDYVSVDAVSWFANMDDSIWNDRMASGALTLRLANGQETYEVALGSFVLRDDTHLAPIFDKPILPDRAYRGGGIGFDAQLTAVENDSVLAGVLKSAANASLGIVTGMVETATKAAGPSQILGAAAADVVNSVRSLLGEGAPKRVPFFEAEGGASKTLDPAVLTHDITYVLIHRGTKFSGQSIGVTNAGANVLPTVDGEPLVDGAWMLLRIRRRYAYTGVREWDEDYLAFRARLRVLVREVRAGLREAADAVREFTDSVGSKPSLNSQRETLTTLIAYDGVLTDGDRDVRAGDLVDRAGAALSGLRTGDWSRWDALEAGTRGSGVADGGMAADQSAGWMAAGTSLSDDLESYTPDGDLDEHVWKEIADEVANLYVEREAQRSDWGAS